MTQDNSARGQVSTPTPPPFSQFASFSQPVSQSTTPQPPPQQQPAPPSQPASDPFAMLGAGSMTSQRASPAQPQQQPVTVSNDDDEWSFSSALPPEPSKPKEHQATVSNTNVKVEMIARRAPGNENAINIIFAFSNNVPQPISELHFQLAVTKVSISILQLFILDTDLCLRATNSSSSPRPAVISLPSRAVALHKKCRFGTPVTVLKRSQAPN
jgi:ADP-ribosylation factor-binding protein GGA